jgi:isopenicillin-N epimerase
VNNLNPVQVSSPSNLRNLFYLRPGLVFLNHGSFGACPVPVLEEYQRWQKELEAQPVEFLGRRFDSLMRSAREPLAQYVNCDADDLVYVPNATTGLNIVARSLDLKPGDEILATDQEYGALERTWKFLCQKNGAIYRRQPIPIPVTTCDDWVEHFWSGVTPQTRVIFMSHISSGTALIFPIREIIRRARQAGIITIVDGAHAAGQIPLDLDNLGVDFYSSNAHKWMLSPKGSAFLFVRREIQPRVEPLVVSWGWEKEKPGMSRFVDEQEWQGTKDIAAFLSVPAAIQFMREHDWEQVRVGCHELASYARLAITDLTGLAPLSPDSTEWYSQMVTLPLPPCDPELLKTRLYDEYQIEVPIGSGNGQQFIRVSVQGYNTRADIDTLVAALEGLLPQTSSPEISAQDMG